MSVVIGFDDVMIAIKPDDHQHCQHTDPPSESKPAAAFHVQQWRTMHNIRLFQLFSLTILSLLIYYSDAFRIIVQGVGI